MRRADMQLRNICRGPIKRHAILYVAAACCGATSLTLRLPFQASPKSISWQRKDSIIRVKGDLPFTPTSSCHRKRGSDHGSFVCVCARANMCEYMCGDCEAGGSAPPGNVHLQFFSSDTVGLLSGLGHREMDCEKVMAPALYLHLPKKYIFTTVFYVPAEEMSVSTIMDNIFNT